MTLAVSTLDGDTTKVEDDELEELRAQLRGDVLTPADDGFDANPIYNAMHNRRPALKVRATGTADVIDAVNFARQRNLLVAVRGGGHSVAGLSSCDGGVVIDLTRMGAVSVDPGGSAGIGAGRRPLAHRRPGVTGVRARRARRRGLRDRRRGAHARRWRGMGAAQVRADHRQPACRDGGVRRRFGPRGVRRPGRGPLLGAARWRRELRCGDPLRLRRPSARPNRGVRRRDVLVPRRRRDPAALA